MQIKSRTIPLSQEGFFEALILDISCNDRSRCWSLDQHWCLPFRSVYDGEEHGRFMEKLEARIRNHDREIEKMCNFHYQGFVDSITELLKVRGEAQKLKVRENTSRCASGCPDLCGSAWASDLDHSGILWNHLFLEPLHLKKEKKIEIFILPVAIG